MAGSSSRRHVASHALADISHCSSSGIMSCSSSSSRVRLWRAMLPMLAVAALALLAVTAVTPVGAQGWQPTGERCHGL